VRDYLAAVLPVLGDRRIQSLPDMHGAPSTHNRNVGVKGILLEPR
jgi:hypothetical protein